MSSNSTRSKTTFMPHPRTLTPREQGKRRRKRRRPCGDGDTEVRRTRGTYQHKKRLRATRAKSTPGAQLQPSKRNKKLTFSAGRQTRPLRFLHGRRTRSTAFFARTQNPKHARFWHGRETRSNCVFCTDAKPEASAFLARTQNPKQLRFFARTQNPRSGVLGRDATR